jgi:hypothetical protein
MNRRSASAVARCHSELPRWHCAFERIAAMGMDFLKNLLGGQQQQGYQDFVNRYQQGPPEQGYTNQEVAQRYQQMAPQLSPDVYQQSAEQAFAQMTPEQRQQFAQWLQTHSQQQGGSAPGFNPGSAGSPPDPGTLAQMTARVHQQQPDVLGQLLGGQSGTALDNPFVKAAAAGIVAMAAQHFLGGR